MRTLFIFCCLFLYIRDALPQSPDWPSIKNQAKPLIADTLTYGTPYIQPHNNLGWEDGVFISRDGLHLYAFYVPADLVRFLNHLSLNPICPTIHPFIRGPLLGIDTITNPFGCTSLLHSDIIYSARGDTSLPFTNWQASNLANPVEFEGGAQTITYPDGSLEFFVYTQSDAGQTDIYWFRDTLDNPVGPGNLMPFPAISPLFYEDNPHLERINDSTLVLFLDDHADPTEDANIYYTISYDNGVTWSSKNFVSSVNTLEEDIHPHLWYDGIDWWMYFASPDPNDEANRLSIFKVKQSIPGDWDSWSNRELVISPGNITDGSGIAAAVGEPTLTAWGDISFVLAIQAVGTSDTTDMFELDPWYLPRKAPIYLSSHEQTINQNPVKIFPNPASGIISVSSPTDDAILSVYRTDGRRVIEDLRLSIGKNQISLNLPPQMYIFKVTTPKSAIVKRVVLE